VRGKLARKPKAAPVKAGRGKRAARKKLKARRQARR
jgi:hypothetical protein